ncbi:MAG: hypothetical protein P1V36_05970 [Planctomycetota bacterium]|nr:hypothetical protein [Planctomycetota bacterium]
MDACNIAGRQVSARRFIGILGFVAGAVLGGALVVRGHGGWVRLCTFPLFLFGALGLLQSLEKV